MFLYVLKNLIFLGILLYLFYQTLFDHYILWIIGFLTWFFLPANQEKKREDTSRYPTVLDPKMAINALTPNIPLTPNILLSPLSLNVSSKQKPYMKKPLVIEDLHEVNEYLAELYRVTNSGIKTPKLKELLDAEIRLCNKKISSSTLMMARHQIVNEVLKVQQLLQTTSREVFREELKKKLGALQEKLNSLTTDLMNSELTQTEVKLNLIQGKEAIESVIENVSEIKDTASSSTDESENSETPATPWLKLCEANTGLDNHHSNLPTTTIEQFDWNQSEKFVKLYLSVPGLKEDDYTKVNTIFGLKHITVFVAGVRKHNYKFTIQELSEPINASESKFRIKNKRIVLFLMKKQRRQWTDLTANETAGRKQSVERVLKEMRVVFTELLDMTAHVEHLPEELRKRMLVESGCLVVDDELQTAHVLKLAQDESSKPPKFVLFRIRVTEPFPDANFEEALKALAGWECYISLQNAQFRNSIDVQEDDQFLRLLSNKPCTLVSFCGRLSREGISLLPTTMMELKLFVSSAEELNALIETTTNVDTLHIRVKTGMDLNNVKKFNQRALQTPLCLIFYGIEDSNIDWLLDAIGKILPTVIVPNMTPFTVFAWSLELLSCGLTLAAHERLISKMLLYPTAVTIHDTTGDPDINNLASSYASRFCKFDIRPVNLESQSS